LNPVDRIIRIELFGQTYTFRANVEASQAERIARYVAKQVGKAQASGEGPSRLDSVILAALNIACDYFEMKDQREKLLSDIDKRCQVLIDYINANG